MSNLFKTELGFIFNVPITSLLRLYLAVLVQHPWSPWKTEGTKVTSLSLGGMDEVCRAEMYLKTEQYVNGFGLRSVEKKDMRSKKSMKRWEEVEWRVVFLSITFGTLGYQLTYLAHVHPCFVMFSRVFLYAFYAYLVVLFHEWPMIYYTILYLIKFF